MIDRMDEYEYAEYNEHIDRQNGIAEAEIKNYERIVDLMDKRKTFATIGTNKAKRRLNKLAKNCPLSAAIRIALEIEDVNIQAKNTFGQYKERAYRKKEELISSLIEIFIANNWVYGGQSSDNPVTAEIAYFEIPSVEQISWHCNTLEILPPYEKEWDGKENSTISKLEQITYRLLKEADLLD